MARWGRLTSWALRDGGQETEERMTARSAPRALLARAVPHAWSIHMAGPNVPDAQTTEFRTLAVIDRSEEETS